MSDTWITVNGKKKSLDGVDPNTTTLNFLRQAGLTGTKEGCAEGECGACAIAVMTKSADGPATLTPVNSCLVLVASLAGQQVWTSEGVAEGGLGGRPLTLHPVQRQMVELGGSQCGYCTPGFVVSLFAEYYRHVRNGYDPESISGNLCRCTGYRPIRDAAMALESPADDDAMVAHLGRSSPVLSAIRQDAHGNTLHRPDSLASALTLLAKDPTAKIIAGGTDLVVEMNQNHVRHSLLVSLDGVAELKEISQSDSHLTIGAGVSLSRIERELSDELPVFHDLFPLFSSRLIRNRATLGGNLVNASPIGDSPPVLLGLDASVLLISESGSRTVALTDFFTGYRTTVLEPGELVVSVLIPKPYPDWMRFYKASKRVMDDISTVAAAIAMDVGDDGTVKRARLAYGGVAATPVRALDAENALVGAPWNEETVAKVAAVLRTSFSPMTDHRGSADYRSHMVARLFEKFFADSGVSAYAGVAAL